MKTVMTKKLTTATCVTLMLLILTSPALAYPPDPDNAALLYYQSYISYEKADDTMQEMVADLSRGKIEPNERIKKYIENCRKAIDLAITAAEIPNCNWGLKYSDGLSMQMAHLAQTRKLVFIITAEARIFAAEGAYQQALDRCLTVRKIGQHIGDETLISFLVSVSINRLADSCIQDILGDMPEDLKMLTSLKNELALIAGRPLSVKAAFKVEKEVFLEVMRPGNIEELVQLLVTGDPTTPYTKEAELLRTADEGFVDKNRDYFENHMDSLQAILSSAMTYETTYAKLKELSEKPQKDVAENPAATLTVPLAPALVKCYGHEVRAKTLFNVIRAAVEVYVTKAKTGQLPEKLPVGLSKDLFSGKDFKYEKTKDAFILRCRGKDLDKDEIYEYEFKVKK